MHGHGHLDSRRRATASRTPGPRATMPDAERTQLTCVLAELCQAVGADGGGALYLDDGDGTLQLAAVEPSQTTAADRAGCARDGDWERRRQDADPAPGRRSRVAWPSSTAAAADRVHPAGSCGGAALRAALRGRGVVDAAPVGKSGWTRQLEAIQRIAARLTRLASVEEVAATICTEIRELIDHDEAHVLVVDATGVLQRVAAVGAAASTATASCRHCRRRARVASRSAARCAAAARSCVPEVSRPWPGSRRAALDAGRAAALREPRQRPDLPHRTGRSAASTTMICV